MSPNVDREDYLEFLDELDEFVQEFQGKETVIGGDFNARSRIWDSHKNWRGALVEEWMASNNLNLENKRFIPTCVRPQGQSVIDLTWMTADLASKLVNWNILEEVETQSDHAYVSFEVDVGLEPRKEKEKKDEKKWNLRKLDKDMFESSLEWSCGTGPSLEECDTPKGGWNGFGVSWRKHVTRRPQSQERKG